MDSVKTQSIETGQVKVLEKAVAGIRRSRETLKELEHTLQLDLKVLRRQEKAPASEIVKQRLRWSVPVTQPMMLCSQIQRSGGTLLTRLFDGHPACFTHPYELKWGRPRKWHWPTIDVSPGVTVDQLLASLDEDWPGKFATRGYWKYSPWTHRNHPEQAKVYPFIFDVDLQRRIFTSVLADQPKRSSRDVLNGYLTSLFNGWLDYQNLYRVPKQWVTAFVPKLVMAPGAVDRFFADYPDGLLVTIVRDPGAWLSSVSRHLPMKDPEAALDGWIESADAGVRGQAAHPDRVIVLLFDDLVRRTEAVMRLLCDRMGLAFSDVLLEPTYNSMPVLSDSSYMPVTGIDVQVNERHRDALTPELISLVTRKAAPRFIEIQERFGLQQQA